MNGIAKHNWDLRLKLSPTRVAGLFSIPPKRMNNMCHSSENEFDEVFLETAVFNEFPIDL